MNKGVTCYQDEDIAKYALTIIWQREGAGRLDYRIQPYVGEANVCTGEHTPKLSLEEISS